MWHYMILNNSVRDWVITLSIIVASVILLRLLKFILIKRFSVFASKTKTTIDDFIISIVQSSVMPVLYLLAIHFALHYLTLSPELAAIENIAIMVVVTFFCTSEYRFCNWLWLPAGIVAVRTESAKRKTIQGNFAYSQGDSLGGRCFVFSR